VISWPAVFPVARVWHAVTAVVAVAALLLHVVLVVISGQGTSPERLLRLAGYFTVQADVFVAAGCGLLALRPERDSVAWRVLRADALVAMVVTILVYVALLRPTLHLSGWEAVADAALHYVCPLMVITGWVLFGPRRRIDVQVVLLAVGWPLGWFAWTLLHGALSGFYPYPFVDVRSLGYGGVLLRAGLATGLLFGLTVAVWTLDRRLNATTPHGWAPAWASPPRP
jgi:hypothetical protein